MSIADADGLRPFPGRCNLPMGCVTSALSIHRCQNRYPVTTELHTFKDGSSGKRSTSNYPMAGRVFVHNRVSDIYDLALK